MTEALPWPPRKEDLVRLYLSEKLSAMKIARAYGLDYKNPKVAESTILYHLKRNGIRRRDPAEHIRKVSEQMVDQWVRRYEGGESLKQISAGRVAAVTVWNHLEKRGVVMRDKVAAQIRAVTKYARRPFAGDGAEKAYLMGIRYGDLHAVRHGRAIRVRVSTTHPAMANLFVNLFSPYGHVARYPRKSKLTGYEWSLESDLDASFDFLLHKATIEELEGLPPGETMAFLAGLFDAEGSVIMHDKRGRYNPEAVFSNTEEGLLNYLARRIQSLGLNCRVVWHNQKEDRNGVRGKSREGRAVVWRFVDAQWLLRAMPIKHEEKQLKRGIVLGMKIREDQSDNLEAGKAWDSLIQRLRTDRLSFIEQARESLRAANQPKNQSFKASFIEEGDF